MNIATDGVAYCTVSFGLVFTEAAAFRRSNVSVIVHADYHSIGTKKGPYARVNVVVKGDRAVQMLIYNFNRPANCISDGTTNEELEITKILGISRVIFAVFAYISLHPTGNMLITWSWRGIGVTTCCAVLIHPPRCAVVVILQERLNRIGIIIIDTHSEHLCGV